MNLVDQLAKATAASSPKRVLGIDLGTTNSTVAQVQLPLNPPGSAQSLCECLPLEQPTKMGPSPSLKQPVTFRVEFHPPRPPRAGMLASFSLALIQHAAKPLAACRT